MFGRLFGKPKARIGAEEFGRMLAEVAQNAEKEVAAGFIQILDELEPDPLGFTLVSMSAVMWGAAHHPFIGRLPRDRCAALVDAYYAEVWERITSRFGIERSQYDEFVHRLGGLIIPDSFKTDWALRTGVHDILSVAVMHIGQAADAQFVAASSDERDAKGVALGDAVGRVLLRAPDRVSAHVSFLAWPLFMETRRSPGGSPIPSC